MNRNKRCLPDLDIQLIKNLDKFDEVPTSLRNSLFERFFREAEIYAFSPDERMAYEQSLKAYRDYNNTLQTAEWMGEEKGRAQGRAEGRVEREREIARKMLEKGIDANTISAVSGMTVQEIETLE